MESAQENWVKVLTEAVLKHDFQVITIDWGNVGHPPYAQAVANIRVVGAMTGNLIQNLMVSTNTYKKSPEIIQYL